MEGYAQAAETLIFLLINWRKEWMNWCQQEGEGRGGKVLLPYNPRFINSFNILDEQCTVL